MDNKENKNEELSIAEIVKRLRANLADEESGAVPEQSSQNTREDDIDDGSMPNSEETLRRFIKKYSSSDEKQAEEQDETVDSGAEEVALNAEEAEKTEAEADEREEAEEAETEEAVLELEEVQTPAKPSKKYRFVRNAKLRAPEEEAVNDISDETEASSENAYENVIEETVEGDFSEEVMQETADLLDTAEQTESAELDYAEEDNAVSEIGLDLEEESNEEQSAPSSKEDLVLMRALGLDVGSDLPDEDYESEDGAEQDEERGFEYTSPSQNKEIMKGLEKEFRISKIRLIIGAVLAFLLLLFEGLPAIGADLPGAFSLYNYPTVYALVDLQLFVLSAALVYVQLWAGARNLFEGYATSESLAFVVAAITGICSVATSIIGATSSSMAYCFPAALCMLITAAFEYMNLKRDVMSFNVASSNRPKHVVNVGGYSSNKREVDAVIDDSDARAVKVLKVSKTSFVGGFFERSRAGSKDNNVNIILISVSLAAMIAFFIVATVRGGIADGLATANAAILFCLPATVFFSNAYPLMKASAKAFDSDCALVGASAVDEYSDASVVIFEDKDVFPAKDIKVKSVKIYDNNRIDQILYWATSVFSRATGPLTEVLLNATVELGHSKDVTLESVDDDGIDAIVDGARILVGTEQFLSEYGIYPTYDPEDDAMLRRGDAGVLFIVREGMICAKFYISYSVDAEFEDILKRLYGAGICAVIKTFDPNINDGLLGRAIKLSRYPVKIVRCTADESIDADNEKISSGIVTKSNVKSLLNTIVMCQNLKGVFKTNAMVKIAGVAVSVIIMLLTVIFGKMIASPLIALYSLVWILPTLLTMKLYLK